jgi:hypothetical protein
MKAQGVYDYVLQNEQTKLALRAELARKTMCCTDNAYNDSWVPVGRPEESFIDLKKAFTNYDMYSEMESKLYES